MPFEKGKSGNPRGRPSGKKNRFTDLKSSFIDAFIDVGGTSKIVKWIKEGNEGDFFKILSKMLPRTQAAHVIIQIEQYAFRKDQVIPQPVIRDFLADLVMAQNISPDVKKKLLAYVTGEFEPPPVMSMRTLIESQKQMKLAHQTKVLPVKAEIQDRPENPQGEKAPSRNSEPEAAKHPAVETGRRKPPAIQSAQDPPPKKKAKSVKPSFQKHIVPKHKIKKPDPEKEQLLAAKKKRLAELERELKEAPD